MARQFENSFDRFAQSSANKVFAGVAYAVIGLLVTGLIVSLFLKLWLVAALFAVSSVSILIFTIFVRRQRNALLASRAAGWIDWDSAMPEMQRQNLNIAVKELSQILEVGPDSINELQSAFIVAEDLALRQIQQEEKVPLMRHVSVAGVPFDAVYSQDDVLVCGEVVFLVAPELKQERVIAMMKKISSVNQAIGTMNIGMRVRLMVVLITQMPDAELEKLRGTLNTGRFSATPVEIDIRLLDFEKLQRIYVTDQYR